MENATESDNPPVQLPFEIDAIHTRQKPTDHAPWHENGGKWTFLDCRIPSPLVTFTVGVHNQGIGGGIFGWGEGILTVADRNVGNRLVEAFAQFFSLRPPPPLSPQPLPTLKFGTAVLGECLHRNPNGGFQGKGGNWTASKWFLQSDDDSAEVYFNYNLKLKKGEFSEKDEAYRDDLLRLLAHFLRDGPRPEGTPQNDPNLTEIGPQISQGTRLCSPHLPYYGFTPSGQFVLYAVLDRKGGGFIYAADPRDPGKKEELVRVEKTIRGFFCGDPDGRQILIHESIPQEPGTLYSSSDPQRLWWVDRTQGKISPITGIWAEQFWYLGQFPLSPNGRFLAIQGARPRPKGEGNYSVIYIHNPQKNHTATIDWPDQGQEQSLQHVGWTGPAHLPRLVFQKGRIWGDGKKEYFEADPVSGQFQPSAWNADRSVSPDGAFVAELEDDDKLAITDVATNERRLFTFHEADRRNVCKGCFRWVSPRYLILEFTRRLFLDVRTLKMNYVVPGGGRNTYTLSPDFQWALWQEEDGIYLSPVVTAPGVEK